jgi:hypothetical protein
MARLASERVRQRPACELGIEVGNDAPQGKPGAWRKCPDRLVQGVPSFAWIAARLPFSFKRKDQHPG